MKRAKLDLRVPIETLKILNLLAEQKILGESVEDVINHILRQKIYEDFIVKGRNDGKAA